MSKPSLVKNSIFNMCYNVLNLLFPLVTSMYVSRVLLPAGVGRVAFARNIVSYFVTFAVMGLPTYGIREIAKAYVKSDHRDLNKTFTQLLCINWITTGISVAVFLTMLASDSFPEDRTLLLCCGIELFLSFINIDWLYQGMEEYVYIVCRSISIKFISLIAIFLLVKTRNDYLIYALITSLAVAGNYIFNMIHARKYVRFDFSEFNLSRHWHPLLILGIGLFFSTIYSKLDITMLGYMYSDAETGLYSNAFRLVMIVIGLCSAMSAVFLPRLSCLYQNDHEAFNNLINYGIGILSFFAFPLLVGLFIMASPAVTLVYGAEFIGSASTIRILSALIIIQGFGNLLCYQLCIATGNEKMQVITYAIAATVNIVLNYMLIPVWGRNGAALASVSSELLLNLIQFVKLKRFLRYKINTKPIVQGILSSLLMGSCVILVIYFLSNTVAICVAGTLSGIIVYFAVNKVMKNSVLTSCWCYIKNKIGGRQE